MKGQLTFLSRRGLAQQRDGPISAKQKLQDRRWAGLRLQCDDPGETAE